MKQFASVACCFAATLFSAVSPARALPREPIRNWVVDYGDTHCTASRSYGTDEKPLTFGMRLSASGKIVRLMVVRRGSVGDPRHIKVNVTHSATPIKGTALRFGSKDRKLDIFWINLERQALDGIAASERIAIRGEGVEEEFALPQIGAVLAALQTCNEDLRKYWNVEGAPGATAIATPARAAKSLAAYLTDEDYPTQALDEGASGTSRFTLLVDEKGMLKDCTVEETSGIASLDAVGCGLLAQRAKFTPALDAAGKPVRSVVSTAVRWITTD
jgi:hypothetical protein